jgi:hypothetical protein
MITFLADRSTLTLPSRIDLDGRAYVLRSITAGRVRPGDYLATRDCTGAAPHAYLTEVAHAETIRPGRGRAWVPLYQRRVLAAGRSRAIPGVPVTPSWLMSHAHSDRYACADRLNVYRAP